MTGSASPIVTIPYDQAYEAGFEDMPRRVPDIAKIRALVGYEPTVELDEILTRVIASSRTTCHEESKPPRRRAAESTARRQAKPVRRLMLATGRDRSPLLPGDRPDREHQHLQRQVRVLPARRHAPRGRASWTSSCSSKIVDECAALGITHVRVHNYGEAFLDRHLVEKVRYAKQKGIKEVGMISNGSLITEKIARGMIEAGLDAINISVDAGGKEVFEQTRLGLNYDKVIANVERLVRIRAELGKRRPKLILSFVRQNNSADEQAFIEHWRNVADKIHITELHNWAGTLNHESDVNYPCYRPWLTFTVLWDGRVSLCCADFDGKTILGDLNTQTIAEIWNADAYPGRPPRASRKRRARYLPAPAICRGKTPRSGLPSSPERPPGCSPDVLTRRILRVRAISYENHHPALRVRGGPGHDRRVDTGIGGRAEADDAERPCHAHRRQRTAAPDPAGMGADRPDEDPQRRQVERPGDHAPAGGHAGTGRARHPAAIRERLHRGAAPVPVANAAFYDRVTIYGDQPRRPRSPPAQMPPPTFQRPPQPIDDSDEPINVDAAGDDEPAVDESGHDQSGERPGPAVPGHVAAAATPAAAVPADAEP